MPRPPSRRRRSRAMSPSTAALRRARPRCPSPRAGPRSARSRGRIPLAANARSISSATGRSVSMFRTPAAIHGQQPAGVPPEFPLELHEGGDEDAATVLLTAEVPAGHALAVARERKDVWAAETLEAGMEVRAGESVLHAERDPDLEPSYGVDHPRDPPERRDGPVVDPRSEVLLDRLHHACRPTARQRGVDLRSFPGPGSDTNESRGMPTTTACCRRGCRKITWIESAREVSGFWPRRASDPIARIVIVRRPVGSGS